MHPTTRLFLRLAIVAALAYGLGLVAGWWIDLIMKGVMP
jgi:hypothetical protein